MTQHNDEHSQPSDGQPRAPRRWRRTIGLIVIVAVAAGAAQVAGVGGLRASSAPAKPKAATLAQLPGSAVPDAGSTELARTSVTAKAGETLRMRGTAKVRVTKVGAKAGAASVVCGIRYSRAQDASWSLGVPYDTATVKRTGSLKAITIDRSFTAPAADTYRMSMRCHVASPTRGSSASATGSMTASRGLPAGAAQPVR